MEESNIYYSSSFLKGLYEKWQTLISTHLEAMTGLNRGLMNISLFLRSSQGKKEYQLGNQNGDVNVNKKHHSEEKSNN